MGTYKGQTFRIPFSRGGWVANPNLDAVAAESMTEARNINLHRGGRETRGGSTKVNGTVISGAPRIMGLFQFRKKDGTEFIVTATADGKIQKDYTTVLKTGLGTDKVTTFEVLNDTLYINNGFNITQLWDGVAGSTSDLAAGKRPSDWTGTNHPKGMKKHGRGVSEALWAYGVASQLQRVYASATGTDDFSDAVVTTIDIETGDGFGVVGIEEFGDRLIPVGKRRAYLIDDLDANRANWGYDAAQWEGGLGALRLLAKTPNDLIAMAEDGEIYSVITTQTTGDYRASSITRPPFIHAWIQDNVDLSKIDDFHMVYDPVLRAMKIFVVRKGFTKVDTALVFFIDRPPEEAWVRHQFFNADFASASALVRVSAGNWKIYAGGHIGFVYELESATATDDGKQYYNGFTMVDNAFDNPRVQKRYDNAWLVFQVQGTEQIKTNIFVDGDAIIGGFLLIDENENEIVDELQNTIEGLEAVVWTTAVTTPNPRLVNINRRLGKIGTRIQQEIFNNAIGERMFLSQVLYDHVVLGPTEN